VGHYYLDSSALVKRYVAEAGTNWIQNLCAPGADHTLYTIRISGAEVVAALFRRVRANALTLADAEAAASQFKIDFREHYQIVEVTNALVEQAMSLAERHGLRGYDSIQLAAAMELQSVRHALSLDLLTLVCADDALNNAAVAEGLTAVNPNHYP